MRCVLLSWIAAATAAAGAGAGDRCASWRLSSGLIVVFLFLFSRTTPLSAKPTISEEVWLILAPDECTCRVR